MLGVGFSNFTAGTRTIFFKVLKIKIVLDKYGLGETRCTGPALLLRLVEILLLVSSPKRIIDDSADMPRK